MFVKGWLWVVHIPSSISQLNLFFHYPQNSSKNQKRSTRQADVPWRVRRCIRLLSGVYPVHGHNGVGAVAEVVGAADGFDVLCRPYGIWAQDFDDGLVCSGGDDAPVVEGTEGVVDGFAFMSFGGHDVDERPSAIAWVDRDGVVVGLVTNEGECPGQDLEGIFDLFFVDTRVLLVAPDADELLGQAFVVRFASHGGGGREEGDEEGDEDGTEAHFVPFFCWCGFKPGVRAVVLGRGRTKLTLRVLIVVTVKDIIKKIFCQCFVYNQKAAKNPDPKFGPGFSIF